MSNYQGICPSRLLFQSATLLFAYAAARYKKLAIPRSPAIAYITTGVLQGVSTKVRTPLGERSKWNWIMDGVSLGLVTYGTSKLELARRVKYLTGGGMIGTQLLISNAIPHTFFGRIAAIDMEHVDAEAEVNALFDEFNKLRKQDRLTPKDTIRVCIALLPKARPFSYKKFSDSAASKLIIIHKDSTESLSGWEKSKAQMDFYECSNEHRIRFDGVHISDDGLSPEEATKRQEWRITTGRWISHRWETWGMNEDSLQNVWHSLEPLITQKTSPLTFDQKIDLCNEYIRHAHKLEGSVTDDNSTGKACICKEALIENLKGFEKCQAYMKHAEFYSQTGIAWKYLFDTIFPEIKKDLSPGEQEQFEDWMNKTGEAIKTNWTPSS